MPHLWAIFLMRLFTMSSEPMLNSRLSFLNTSCRLIICMGMSISLIWNGTCLLAFRHNPRCAVHLNDVVGGQVLDVRERDARPTTEQEQVSCQCKVGIVQLDCAQRLDYIFCEKATLLMVGGNMIHRKRISRYFPVIVGCGDDVFQRYGVYTHG